MTKNERIANYAAAIQEMVQPRNMARYAESAYHLAKSIEILVRIPEWTITNEASFKESDRVADAILNPQHKTIGKDCPI